jgi:WD40 repeat protein
VVLLGGPEGHTHAVLDAAFSPDGQRILTLCKDGRALLWPGSGIGKPRVLLKSSVNNEWGEHGRWALDGRAFCTASSSSRVQVWSSYFLSEHQTTLRHVSDLAHIGSIAEPVFSADGRRLVTGGSVDAMIRVWALDESQRPFELATGGIVTAVDLSQDGRWVLGAIESGPSKCGRSSGRTSSNHCAREPLRR